MDNRQNFLKGAVVLSVAGAISKVLGALYRIPLARLIGGEGMGLYQMAYPIYTTILSLLRLEYRLLFPYWYRASKPKD